MLDRSLQIKCGWCGENSTLGEWNDKSYEQCKNREMKRAFTLLTNEKAFDRKSDTYYLCPKCGKWSMGCQLSIVNTDNKKLLGLGGKPIIFGSKEK